MNRIIFTTTIFFFSLIAFAQKKQIVLHTNVKTLRNKFPSDPPITKRNWILVAEPKPDVLNVWDQKIQFISDIDSVFIKVDSKHPVCDFLIIYQKKDTFYTQVRYTELPDYVGKLKSAKKYNLTDQRVIPSFTYQDSSNIHLKALREKYNLDSIAGEAGEINQMLNLMHWIHNLVPHDGQHGNPANMNATELIAACSDGSRGLNCRGLAITLNECFLALGFKSRYVTCMPKELEFDDCHVINMVYSTELKKWIYLDPTNDAYVMNEKGELLSIQEVRERLINGKPLLLNPGANWNNSQRCFPEDYLYFYMAKNLYRIESPVSSEYNYETRRDGASAEFIELVPLDGLNQSPQKSAFKSKEKDFTYIHYITNNPDLFWKAPPSKN